MNFIKKNYKTILIYTFLFFMFLIWNMIINGVNIDEIWNYGFSYSLFKGEVPYRDFNMVITPFSPFLFSLPFFIFGNNILILHITNALMLVLLFHFSYKIIGKRAWYLILFLCFPLNITYPSYNLLLLFLFILLIYCEEKTKSDYLIGFLIGLTILTKQSVGTFLILPSLYYLKKKNKILKRLVGFIIPILIFIVYMIITNSYKEFLDLCFFGLFDFAEENGRSFNIFYIITIIIVIGTFYIIKKNPKDIKSYYTLMFYSIILPMFDVYHVQMSFVAFLLLIFINKKEETKLNPMIIVVCSIIGISIVNVTDGKAFKGNIIYPNDIKHFEYRYRNEKYIKFTKQINKFIKQNKDKEIIFLDYNGYYIKIINDMPISYFDLLNRGNWGYNGSHKLVQEIKKKKDAIFVVDREELKMVNNQTDKNAIRYVLKHGKKTGKLRFYELYTLK